MKKTFRRRNSNVDEFSGHEEASEELRNRITLLVSNKIHDGHRGIGANRRTIRSASLNNRLQKEYGSNSMFWQELIVAGAADDVFTVVELFLNLCQNVMSPHYYGNTLEEMKECFELSGSVYEVNSQGYIELSIDENTSKEINEAKKALEDASAAQKKLEESATTLIKRGKSEKVIRDAYLALEKYLKQETGVDGKNSYNDAVNLIFNDRPIQKEFMSKIKGFKGETKDASHDSSFVAEEIDALWYLRVVSATIRLINNIQANNK